ncbi:hypothetical protein K7432_018535, partial [Basidiobolus ranarum]
FVNKNTDKGVHLKISLKNNSITGSISTVDPNFKGSLDLDNNFIKGPLIERIQDNSRWEPWKPKKVIPDDGFDFSYSLKNNLISGKARVRLSNLDKISGNQIEELELVNTEHVSQTYRSFYIGKNKLKWVPKIFLENQDIKTFVFKDNALEEVEFPPNTRTLNLDNNNIRRFPTTDPPKNLVSCSVKHNPIICDRHYLNSPWRQLCNTDCTRGPVYGDWITLVIVLALLVLFITLKIKRGWKQAVYKYFWVLDFLVDAFVLIWMIVIGYMDTIVVLHFTAAIISAMFYMLNLRFEKGYFQILGHAIGDLSQTYTGIILALKTHTYVPLLSTVMAIITIVIGTKNPDEYAYEQVYLE